MTDCEAEWKMSSLWNHESVELNMAPTSLALP